MKKGVFIAIEGGDGSGKSSAVQWLKQELGEEKFLFTREPGGIDSAEEIRNVLVKHREQDLEVLTQLFLFEAGRTEHVTKKIRPALESGMHVITDRFSASSYAYQVVAGGAPHLKSFFEDADQRARGGLLPDLTIFLDVAPEIGIARKSSSGDELNTFDTKELAFYTNVRNGVKEYLADKPHVTINAEQSQENVRGAIKKEILKITT
ncbi:MAG: dTMP kinase [Patescibacteria group bacterium]